MSKFNFELKSKDSPTIKIQADKGLLIKDWKDLTAPSCLAIGVGRFTIEDNETNFFGDGVGVVFRMFGEPFDVEPGAEGSASLVLTKHDCYDNGWRWFLISVE